jgi:hypothetical protein
MESSGTGEKILCWILSDLTLLEEEFKYEELFCNDMETGRKRQRKTIRNLTEHAQQSQTYLKTQA